jgi:multicomponent Na+:H+ antiporter subunit E
MKGPARTRRPSWLDRGGTILWLTVAWCAVMEPLRVGTVALGLAVAVALTLLFPARRDGLSGVRFRPWAFLVMNARFFVELVRANLQVAWAVIAPRRAGLRRGIVAVPLVPSTNLVVGLVANAVSLTPGTLILDVDREPAVLYIHVLRLRTEAELHRHVIALQRSIVRALGDLATLAAVDARLAALEKAIAAGREVPPVEGP